MGTAVSTGGGAAPPKQCPYGRPGAVVFFAGNAVLRHRRTLAVDDVLTARLRRADHPEPSIDRGGFHDGIGHVADNSVIGHAAQIKSEDYRPGTGRPELCGVPKAEHADAGVSAAPTRAGNSWAGVHGEGPSQDEGAVDPFAGNAQPTPPGE
jgi:hypothetical protein